MNEIVFSKIKIALPSQVRSDWIRGPQLCGGLRISADTLERILKRQPFSEKETTFISEMTAGGPQMVRVFSRRGALKVALLSHSPKRGDVVLAILDLAERGTERSLGPVGIASEPPPAEMVQVLDEVKRLLLQGELTTEVIEEFQTGQRAPAPEGTMVGLADEWEAQQKAMAAVQAAFRDIDRRAVRAGYGQGAVKRFVSRRRKMQHPQLAFGEPEDANAGL